jgi:hypothetical protein
VTATRDIRTNESDVSCDVCGRNLLRGEHAESFLAAGARRNVCELCTVRAQHEGWIREAGGDDLGIRHPSAERRRRGLLARLRDRRVRAREMAEEEAAHDTSEEEAASPEAPRRPRNVRAVPTNADLKMQRALEIFNASQHPRTVGGVARSLGPPAVCVRPLPERPSVVSITVMWELSWYRFEIDLSDEAGGVRRDAQGTELGELVPDEMEANAAADQRGTLQLALDG